VPSAFHHSDWYESPNKKGDKENHDLRPVITEISTEKHGTAIKELGSCSLR